MKKPRAAVPKRIQLVGQRTPADCAVCCLAMALEASYEDVYVEVSQIDELRAKGGLCLPAIEGVAERLGRPLLRLRRGRYDPHKDFGILSVSAKGCVPHVVVLWDGKILDPLDTSMTRYEDYLVIRRAKATCLLVPLAYGSGDAHERAA